MPITFTDLDTINSDIQSALNGLNDNISDAGVAFQFVQQSPYNNQYVENLTTLKNIINTKINALLEIDNYLLTSIPELNSSITNLKKSIIEIETKNKADLVELQTINQSKNSAKELIYNYKQMYYVHFLRNWGILLSIIISLFVISTIFKSRIITK